MKPAILIHYGEIALKGKNRHLFEKRFVENIRTALPPSLFPDMRIQKTYGRVILEYPEALNTATFQNDVRSRLQRVCGVEHFAFAYTVDGGYEQIKQTTIESLQSRSFETFAVRAHRSFKGFPMTSQEINEQLGGAVIEQYGSRVSLGNPDVEIFVIITAEAQYLFFEKYPGPGGLPVGSSGSVISLLSAGIDSPVASYRMMKRGAKVLYLHFHSYPLTSRASMQNVQELIRVLQYAQPASTLFFAPLGECQKTIVAHAPAPLRVILYRRVMFRVAAALAQRVGAGALITGESLGQVASQTLANMHAATEGIALPILRPLIGHNKQEIITEARQIGTYDISIRPYEDCCSLLLPSRVETHASLEEVKKAEKLLPWEEMIAEVLGGIESIDV